MHFLEYILDAFDVSVDGLGYDWQILFRTPGAAPPEKSHPAAKSEHEHAESVAKHQEASKPAWLLALEIVTGSIAGFLLLFGSITAWTKLKGKNPVIIPWKKTSSQKDEMIIYIG